LIAKQQWSHQTNYWKPLPGLTMDGDSHLESLK